MSRLVGKLFPSRVFVSLGPRPQMEVTDCVVVGNGAPESTRKLFVRVTRNTRDAEHRQSETDGHSPSNVLLLKRCGNDPSAGSPTETLLRLHLPLNDEV